MNSFKSNFYVNSDVIIVGDPINGGDYVELENPLVGEWRSIVYFRGTKVSKFIIIPYTHNYRVHAEDELYIDNNSGYVGVFDSEKYINDGSNIEYEEIIIETCNVKQKFSGTIDGGCVVRPNDYDSENIRVVVGKSYEGEIVELTLDFD